MFVCNHIGFWSGVNCGKRQCKEIVKKQTNLHEGGGGLLTFFGLNYSLHIALAVQNPNYLKGLFLRDVINPDGFKAFNGP